METTAAKIVRLLMADLDDRSGYDLPHDDRTLMDSWRDEWEEIVEKVLMGVGQADLTVWGHALSDEEIKALSERKRSPLCELREKVLKHVRYGT
jgi:hypothetical protein